MKLETYYNPVHKDMAIKLLESRGMPTIYASSLPSLGCVVVDEASGEAIAMGFLRRAEGNLGILDSYITNSFYSSEIRNEALDMVTFELIQNTAREQGIIQILAFSKEEHIIKRAEKHGMISYPDHIFQVISFT